LRLLGQSIAGSLLPLPARSLLPVIDAPNRFVGALTPNFAGMNLLPSPSSRTITAVSLVDDGADDTESKLGLQPISRSSGSDEQMFGAK
jgi:hypothetical protein